MDRIEKKEKGISLWALLLILLGLAFLSIAALGTFLYLTRSEKIKAERKLEEVEAKETRDAVAKRETEAAEKLALSRAKQEEALVLIRAATASLEQLLSRARVLAAESSSLSTNELGRMLAAVPDLALQGKRYLDEEFGKVPRVEEVATRIQNLRRLEEQVVSSFGTLHEPSADIGKAAAEARAWSDSASPVVSTAEMRYAALTREAKVRSVAPGSVSLNDAVTALTADKIGREEEERTQKREAAKAAGAKAVAEAEATKIVQEARLKADAILSEANRKAEEAKRDLSLRDAESKAETAKTDALVRDKERETTKIVLREKASDPAVRAKLTPFTTPGYLQIDALTSEKKPHSFSQMLAFGALEPNGAGLERLVEIGATKRDRVRPRWQFKRPNSWKVEPQELEGVKETQKLLVELGPVLVEMGLLSE